MTADDVLAFVSRREGQPIRTIGERKLFRAKLTATEIVGLTLENGRELQVQRDEISRVIARFSEGPSFITTQYSHLSRHSSYLLALFRELILEKAGPSLTAEEMSILDAPETERRELVNARVGQGLFRDELIKLRKSCYVTGLADSRFLRASHIKPWCDSKNSERLDPNNGLLLSPNFDHLFDSGFITFRDDGGLIISKDLPANIQEGWRIPFGFRGADLGPLTKGYLKYHREKIFLDRLFSSQE